MAIDSNGSGLLRQLGMLRNNPAAANELTYTNTVQPNVHNNIADLNVAANRATMAESNLNNANSGQTIPMNFNKLGSEKLATQANNIFATGLKTQSLNLKIGHPCNYKHGRQGELGNEDFDLQITPDNLEILGTVSVSGRMPLISTVALNGNLPTNALGSVNFSCGSRTNIVSS